MTDEQINRAIAEACGITQPDQYGTLYRTENGWEYNCPNYCTDLNAMYEAEAQMDEIDWVFFMTQLAGLVRMPKQAEVQIKQLVHSTARQRAEAFLRTLGKWEDATDKDSLTVEATTEQSSVDHLREATKMMGKEVQG